jgi:hypothetical protein
MSLILLPLLIAIFSGSEILEGNQIPQFNSSNKNLLSYSKEFTGENLMNEQTVTIEYTNWRGEKGMRKILPEKIYFGSTEWHKEPQWLLRALDLEKNASRDFAIKDICSWQ